MDSDVELEIDDSDSDYDFSETNSTDDESVNSNATDKSQNSDWVWEEKLNSFKIIPFDNKNVGVNADIIQILDKIYNETDEIKEYDVFSCFANNEFWQHIVDETNYDANSFYLNNKNKADKWFDCTTDEMKAYFALAVLMGQIRKPKISQYWTRRRIIKTDVFNEIMPYSRFMLISRFLRFSKRTTQANNPKEKIQKILDMLIKQFKYIYT